MPKLRNTKTEEQSETTKSHFNGEWFKRLEECGVLRDELASIGWAFWPKDQNDQQMGFFDEGSLRALADEIERRNKPFWDEYNAHCLREWEAGQYNEDFLEGSEGVVFPDVLDTDE
jgi:hypothetical protein